MSKKCRKCGELKSFSGFAKSGIKDYPYRATCKLCNNAAAKLPKDPLKQFCQVNCLKICGKCKIVKPLNAFYKTKTRKTSNCKECRDFCLTKWRENNKEKTNLIAKNWRDRNPDKVKEMNQINYLVNREHIIKQTQQWVSQNRGKHNAYHTLRNLSKIQRTPKWLTKENLLEIEVFYKKAQELTNKTKIKYQVDHIVPLNGKNVSGLHVPGNLQILTQKENIKKFNNF